MSFDLPTIRAAAAVLHFALKDALEEEKKGNMNEKGEAILSALVHADEECEVDDVVEYFLRDLGRIE